MLDFKPDVLLQAQIRQLVKEDLPGLEWEGEYIHFRRLFQDAYRLARMGNAVLWVATLPGAAEEGERMIGQVFVQLNSASLHLADGYSRAYLYSFRVRPELRSLGLGSLILETAEKDVFNRGFSKTLLNCGKDNPNARRFYERHGYRVVGSEPGEWSYFDHEGVRRFVSEPAWRMEKQLR